MTITKNAVVTIITPEGDIAQGNICDCHIRHEDGKMICNNEFVVKKVGKAQQIQDEIPDMAYERVVFNPPATIVLWADGTKTVVKCDERDTYDKAKGLALCFMKRALGNTSRALNDVLHGEVYAEADQPEHAEEKKPVKKNLLVECLEKAKKRNVQNDCPMYEPDPEKVAEQIANDSLTRIFIEKAVDLYIMRKQAEELNNLPMAQNANDGRNEEDGEG